MAKTAQNTTICAIRFHQKRHFCRFLLFPLVCARIFCYNEKAELQILFGEYVRMSITPDSYATYLFHEGTNYQAQKMFSPAPAAEGGEQGWKFAVWAPNAAAVSVVGDFNGWDASANPMEMSDGIWSAFIPGLKQYDTYKYAVTDKKGRTVFKCDPYGLHFETAPANASKLYDISGYRWKDRKWMTERKDYNPYGSPMNIYEVHAGSWRRYPDGNCLKLYRACGSAHPLSQKDGIHARGAHARDGISLRRQLGLSGDGHVRAHLALRHAARFHGIRGPLPSLRDRRHSGLGACALPPRRARSGDVRRHSALRVRRPEERGAQGVGHQRSTTSARTR